MILRMPKVRMSAVLSILSLLALFETPSYTLVFQLLVILGATLIFEYAFWRVRGIEPFLPSAGIVTALIIFLLAGPQASLSLLLLAVFVAVGIKQFIRPDKNHIFNPAASGLFIASFFGLPITWWGISSKLPFLLLTILLAGFVSIYTIRQHRIVFPFLISTVLISGLFWADFTTALNQLLVGSFWFFSLVMLPEPMTAAHYPNTRIAYAIAVAVLSFLLPLAGVRTGPLITALLAGNLIFWIIERKLKIQK